MTVRDPGLQPERTLLAWRRTTLAGTVAAVLGAKAALHGGTGTLAVLGTALCALAWAGLLTVARLRTAALTASGRPRALEPRLAAAAALCTVALAVCAAVIVR